MQYSKNKYPPRPGLFEDLSQPHSKKNLLCIWPPGLNGNNLLQELSESGWHILPVESAGEQRELLAGREVSVGLVLVDCSWDQAHLENAYRAILGAPQLTWYAVLADRRPMSSAVCNLVAVHCDDFFSPPYDTRRIQQTLGHGAGMYLLRQHTLKPQVAGSIFEGMIGESELMLRLFRDVKKIARSDAPVLLHGESGTGKELTARAIHHLSRRAGGPFKVVNCAAVPASLIQSELFGHEKGAFTGAQARYKGRLESAQGGVIFLDEISDMPLEQQVNLLRFLEDKCIERLGGSSKIEVDVRVIAATHDNLDRAVGEGTFREDLFYRLNVLRIDLPSLRERSQDIEVLARFAIQQFAEEAGNQRVRGFTRDAVAAMQAHDWPGNVRELVNRVRRALVMTEGHVISAADLDLRGGTAGTTGEQGELKTLEDFRDDADRRAVIAALRTANHNVSRAARILQISRTTLYRMMDKLDIPG